MAANINLTSPILEEADVAEQPDGLPPLVQPKRTDVSPQWAADWMQKNRSAIEQALACWGALKMRGFGLKTSVDFGKLIECFPSPPLGYSGGATPRGAVAGRVMEATSAPVDVLINLHQEMAYLRDHPERLAFFCEKAASTGGATTIGDMRAVTTRVDPRFFAMLRERGLLYRRYFRSVDWSPGDARLDTLHRTWNQAFGTDDPAEAEALCGATGSDCEWIDGGLLASFRADSVATHPATGEEVMFNNLTGFHINARSVGAELFETYERLYGDRLRPYHVTFGDGAPIPTELVYGVYELLDAATVAPFWQDGDVMLLDNLLTAHGRERFTGERLVRVVLLN